MEHQQGKIEERVLAYVKEHGLLDAGDSILAGVSGGADSVCLLFVLLRLQEHFAGKLRIEVVHVHHGLRGAEAQEDLQYVEQLCLQQGLPFHPVYEDVAKIAKAEGISTEEAGRKARYGAMERIASERGLDSIAVAHHLDDQAETILMNLFRGSGMRGMAGIQPRRGRIIRPLLCLSRAEIEQYLDERLVAYRTDATNLSCDYTRNKLRNELLPYVKSNINDQAVQHIVRFGAYASEAEQYLQKQAQILFHKYGKIDKKEVILSVECLQEERIMSTYLVRHALEQLGCGLRDITHEHIGRVCQQMLGRTGARLSLPGGIIVEKSYGHIHFSEGGQGDEEGKHEPVNVEGISPETGVTIHFQGEIFTFTVRNKKKSQIFPKKKYTKWFDYGKIDSMLQLRTRQPGDMLAVCAGGGQKKLNRYFIDEKVPRADRDRCILLALGSQILWVVGGRISEAYKVQEDTRQVLEVACVSAAGYESAPRKGLHRRKHSGG